MPLDLFAVLLEQGCPGAWEAVCAKDRAALGSENSPLPTPHHTHAHALPSDCRVVPPIALGSEGCFMCPFLVPGVEGLGVYDSTQVRTHVSPSEKEQKLSGFRFFKYSTSSLLTFL